MESYCQPNDKVLLLSSNESENSNLFTETEAEKISSVIGNENYLTRATCEQITHCDKPLYDVVLSKTQLLSGELLVNLIKLIIPNGKLVIIKTPGKDCQSGALVSCLKLSGYVNINETPNEMVAYKPNYEIGSSVKINPTLEAQTSTNGHETKAPAAKVWSLAAMDLTMTDNDVELINDDDLLDEEDKKKPDAASLRVCETTKKRKACANCSCGLAQELEQEVKDNIKQNSQNAKSSCGSCYLGDAFRCASCPYLGMPAFKPGEKVVLDMSSDL